MTFVLWAVVPKFQRDYCKWVPDAAKRSMSNVARFRVLKQPNNHTLFGCCPMGIHPMLVVICQEVHCAVLFLRKCGVHIWINL